MSICELPDDVLLNILQFMEYDNIAKIRAVCQRFNQISQTALNAGFYRVIKKHTKIYSSIKALLPRRESERRAHVLARHVDILSSVDTRISMLTMAYSKYIERSLCCFIPGRVLDEINNILNIVSATTADQSKELRPYDILQELRDISSMAIEHFEEKISLNLLKGSASDPIIIGYPHTTHAMPGPSKSATMTRECRTAKEASFNSSTSDELIQILRRNYKKANNQIQILRRSQAKQSRLLHDALTNIAELGAQFIELKKRLANGNSPAAVDYTSSSLKKRASENTDTDKKFFSKIAKFEY